MIDGIPVGKRDLVSAGFVDPYGDIGRAVQMEVLRVPKEIKLFEDGLAWRHAGFDCFKKYEKVNVEEINLPDAYYLPEDPHALAGPDREFMAEDMANFLRIYGYIDYYSEKKTTPKLLTDFLKLGSPNSIKSFAEKYGVFGFADESASHADQSARAWPCLWSRRFSGLKPREVYHEKPIWYWESMDQWRVVIARAEATLRMACALAQGWQVPVETARIALASRAELPPFKKENWYQGSDCLVACLNGWLLDGEITIRIARGGSLAPVIVGNGLFAALALQIVLLVSKDGRVAFCGSCGDLFTPKNSKIKFCPRCGKQASWRKAQQKQRLKRKEQDQSGDKKTRTK